MRIDWQQIDRIASQLASQLPPGMKHLKEDLQKNFRNVLESALNELELVTREEFDAQVAVLKRTREKLDQLERELNQ